jgi:HK97 family phage major capsid protein/HK97 family phage prohead protease
MGPTRERVALLQHPEFEQGGALLCAGSEASSANSESHRVSLTAPLITKEQAPRHIERAWATLKFAEPEAADDIREIKGVASTPTPDRMGDIVEPEGLEFRNPLPLIWQHKHDQPLGLATLDKPTKDGVTFTARFADAKPGTPLATRIDDAKQNVRLGLIRGMSIGFRTLEMNFMDNGGIRFVRSEVVELSLVTIPANHEATINQIKAFDAVSSILPDRKSETRKLPDASGPKQTAKGKDSKMQTIAEQISAFEGQRKTAQDRMSALMAKSAEDGRTLDEAEATEYDGLETQSKQISEHVVRLQRLDADQKKQAIIVAGDSLEAAAASRGGGVDIGAARSISIRSAAPKGQEFVRYVIALGAGQGDPRRAQEYVRNRTDWVSSTPNLAKLFDDKENYIMRAAVPAGVTYDPTWAGALVYPQLVTSEFAEFLRPLTIIGRIPGLRRVPFNIKLPRATGGTTAQWVGEAAPKPLTSMTFDTLTLTWAKAAAIVVLTEELIRFSNPAAEDVVRNDLARGIVQFLDRQFVDPAVAAVTGVSPASITNGISPITPSGVNMAAFRADTRLLFQAILAVNQPTASGVWIMTQQQALALSLAQNALGQIIYTGITPQGGTLMGYPVVTSENMPAVGGSPADGYPIIFAIADEILLADDGQVVVDASREASVNMDSTPDSPPTASTNMISLWQLNMMGIRAERWITWLRRRTSAVAWIQGAHYAE